MLSIFNFFISFIFFLVSAIVCLYLPGFLVFKKIRLKTDEIEQVAVSFSLGIVFFVLISLLLSFLQLRSFFLPVILFLSLITLKKFGLKSLAALNFRKWRLKKRKVFFLVIVLGILAQLWINIFSGWQYADGVRFWSAHGHDGLWHGSVIQEIRDRFPPRMKFISGFKIQNYHYFVDILMGDFYRLFKFDPLDLYFRHFTFVFAVLFLLNVFVFVRHWRDEKAALWATFLMIFAGSFGYLLTLIKNQTLTAVRSEAKFWVSQGNTAIGNPPQIAAFILFLTFLNLFLYWCQKKSRPLFWTLVILGSLLFGFKIYAAATILGGLFLLSFWQLVFQRKTEVFKLFLTILVPSLLVFFSTTSKGSSFLVFQPWWFVRTMVVAGDRLDWIDLELKRQFYLAQHSWRGYLRVFQFELMAGLIFVVGNLGIKILGFGEVFRAIGSRVKPALFDLFLVFSLSVCFVFPHIFVQKGVAWNTVQFFHYFILIMALFSAVTIEKVIAEKRGWKKVVAFGLIIFLSVPTVIADLRFFAPHNALAIVENEELRALEVLQEKTGSEESLVTYPFNPWAAAKFPEQPRPIFAWDSTGYVSYFTDRPTFITDEGQVEIMGYSEGKKRRADLQEYLFYSGSGAQVEKDPLKARQFLVDNNLKYIYLVYDQEFAFDSRQAGLEKIFENQVARIYEVVEIINQ